MKEISKTEKGPAKRDSQQITIANAPAQVESRELRTSNISKKSKTSKPANTKSKTLKSQKTANSKVTNSPSNRISKKKDLDDSNQESDVDSADSLEEESDVEISIEEVDDIELSELGADQRGIQMHQSNTYATNQKHNTNKKAKKRSGSASSEEAEDDFVCVPLSNLNKDTMTFQNREMLMKKSLMLSEVSGLND